MQYYISYFGQMRNLSSDALPISTVKWEQDWFRGKIPHATMLIMPDAVVMELEKTHEMCRKSCELQVPCRFMQMYKEYLDTLDFDRFMRYLDLLALQAAANAVVLMVYEKPSVLCAERPVLQQWFAEHGIELKEWEKPSSKQKVQLF